MLINKGKHKKKGGGGGGRKEEERSVLFPCPIVYDICSYFTKQSVCRLDFSMQNLKKRVLSSTPSISDAYLFVRYEIIECGLGGSLRSLNVVGLEGSLDHLSHVPRKLLHGQDGGCDAMEL